MWSKLLVLLPFLAVTQALSEHPRGYQRANRTDVKSSYKEVDPRDIWIVNNEELYFSSFRATFEAAMAICDDMGMGLVSLDTFDKNLAVKDFINDYEYEIGSIYWTSGRRINDEFEWSSNGILFTYTDWGGGDNRPELRDCCVEISHAWNWYRSDCNLIYRFICQWK